MDYKYIESLVKLAKEKDIKAQELLVEEFKPIIYGLTKKISASGYEREDLISESYRILFNCIKKINYSIAVKKKKLALDKIKIPFNEFINNTYNI